MSSCKNAAYGLAVGAMVVLAPTVASAQNFGICPTVGTNSSGCALLIDVGASGALTFNLNGTDSSPYDGADDALVGVVNHSGRSISNLFLDGGSVNIFGFESDGLCSSFGAPFVCPSGGFGPTGYEGPNTSFSGINSGTTSGFVNFLNPLSTGGTAFFTLEETPQAIVNGGIGGTTTTPEPSSFALLGTGLIGMVPILRRRRR